MSLKPIFFLLLSVFFLKDNIAGTAKSPAVSGELNYPKTPRVAERLIFNKNPGNKNHTPLIKHTRSSQVKFSILNRKMDMIRLSSNKFSKRTLPGSLEDKHLRFIGRWNFENKNEFISYWGGAYIKVKFTGTSIKMIVGNKSNFFAKIDDGPWMNFRDVADTVNLAEERLTDTIHTIIVTQGKDYDYTFKFRGFILNPGARTAKPIMSPLLIEYIGDSITAGYTDSKANVSAYSWIAADSIGAEHIQIAFPGICLVDGFKNTGMVIQYYKAQSGKSGAGPDWSFGRFKPHVIIVNLGTNDQANSIPDSIFRRAYINFLISLRKQYPHTEIAAMRTFLGLKSVPTLEAVQARRRAGDKKVFFIDTTDWIRSSSSDYNDGAHPSDNGQLKAGRLLAESISKLLGK